MAALYLHASTLAGSDCGLLNYDLCCAASFPLTRVVSLTNQLRLVNHGEPAVHWFNLRSQGRPRGIGPMRWVRASHLEGHPSGRIGNIEAGHPILRVSLVFL